MPGLIRGVARTAVIAGTATHVANNVSRRQANRWAEQDAQQEQQYYAQQAAMPQAAPASNTDKFEQLKQLAELHTQGVLTDAEFEAQKAIILSQ
jgi:hypothetical protein